MKKTLAFCLLVFLLLVGPTSKGGCYLIGISVGRYNRESFKNLKWETKYLWDDLLCYAKSNSTSYYVTRCLNDINNYNELQEFATKFSYYSSTSRLICKLTSSQKINISLNYIFVRISVIRFLFDITAPPSIYC